MIAPEVSEWNHLWSNVSATGSTVASYPNSSDPLNCGCFSTVLDESGCAQTCLDGNGYDYGHFLWNDQKAWDSFDIVGAQQYDSQTAYPWPSDVNGGVRDKEVWQTEMSGRMHWPEEGPSVDIKNGLAVGRWIHDALTVGEASAWLYFWYEAHFQNDNEGLALVQGTSAIAKRYYVLGNYSKFVRPESVALAVTGTQTAAGVLLSAYRSLDGRVVVVGLNPGDAPVSIPITFAGGTAPAVMMPFVTSATMNLEVGTAVSVQAGVLVADFPAQTAITFVAE